MSDNNTNDPNNLDDDFDVEEEFVDVDLDEESYEEADFSEDVDGDVEYTDEDFAEEEWADDEAAAAIAADPNNKKLYRGGSAKKSGLSFNAIVIIGAVVVGGGVLAFTVMSKSQEVATAKSSIFRSVLNIGDIMDGRIFGDKPKEDPTITPETPVDGTTPAADGFLNNPDQLATTETPPQPSPIAPGDTTASPNEPLTPLPEDGAQVPRGPDVVAPPEGDIVAVTPETIPAPADPVVTDGNKAEELLKEAMSNRDQAAAPEVVPPAPFADTAAVPAVPATPEVIAEPAPPTPVAEQPPIAAVAPVIDEQTKESVKALEAKIDQLLNRMNNIESDLSTIKQAGSPDLKQIEQSVQSLKQDLNEIKSRPAPEKVVRSPDESVNEEPKPAPVKKKKVTTPKKTASTDSVYKAPVAAGNKWELRAAQPGKAWVSKPGERDMRGVQIGETLPGIGQITGIIYQGGRWTVQGTQGQILQ